MQNSSQKLPSATKNAVRDIQGDIRELASAEFEHQRHDWERKKPVKRCSGDESDKNTRVKSTYCFKANKAAERRQTMQIMEKLIKIRDWFLRLIKKIE